MHSDRVDLQQYYDEVEALIDALRAVERGDLADRVEDALRGGSTSGEVLGGLGVMLPAVGDAVPALADRSDALADWASRTLP